MFKDELTRKISSNNRLLQQICAKTSDPTLDPTPTPIDNRHAEVLDTGTLTLSGVANYSYSILSGSATVTINGVTISGLPVGFDARQGETTSNTLLNDITITGDALGARVIVYYEIAAV